jgi:TRAP-type C4-dicarboxylate transport system permease small subunit
MTISSCGVHSRLLLIVHQIIDKVGLIALWLIVWIVFLQVVSRYVFALGVPWPDEIARYFHILLVYFGISLVSYSDRHVKVQFLFDRFRESTRIALHRTFLFVEILVAGTFAVGGVHLIYIIGAIRTPGAGLPLWIFFLPVSVGFAILAVQTIGKVAATFRTDLDPDIETA